MARIKDNMFISQRQKDEALDKKYRARPLTRDELSFLNYAWKKGFLDDETSEEFVKHPEMARDYIDRCEAFDYKQEE